MIQMREKPATVAEIEKIMADKLVEMRASGVATFTGPDVIYEIWNDRAIMLNQTGRKRADLMRIFIVVVKRDKWVSNKNERGHYRFFEDEDERLMYIRSRVVNITDDNTMAVTGQMIEDTADEILREKGWFSVANVYSRIISKQHGTQSQSVTRRFVTMIGRIVSDLEKYEHSYIDELNENKRVYYVKGLKPIIESRLQDHARIQEVLDIYGDNHQFTLKELATDCFIPGAMEKGILGLRYGEQKPSMSKIRICQDYVAKHGYEIKSRNSRCCKWGKIDATP